MSKRFISMLLAVIMVAGLVPAVQLAAASSHTNHAICGGSDLCTKPECTHSVVSDWKEYEKPDSSVLTSGNYYLTEDINHYGAYLTIAENATVTICLNGHTLNFQYNTYFKLNSNSVLNICDCGTQTTAGSIVDGVWVKGDTSGTECNLTGGIITSSEEETLFYVENGATLNIYGGNIAGSAVTSNYSYKKSVVSLKSANMNMYGGNIVGNKTNLAAVAVYGSTFNMYGGVIGYNSTSATNGSGAVHVYGSDSSNRSTFNMYGGDIKNNSSTNGFGGVCVANGDFNMYNGNITGNTGTSSGGVYVNDTSLANITGGKITGNSSGVTNNKGELSISGKPYIFGNGDGSSRINLVTNTSVTVNGLTEGAKIGIGSSNTETLQVIDGTTEDVLDYVFSDTANRALIYEENRAVTLYAVGERDALVEITLYPTIGYYKSGKEVVTVNAVNGSITKEMITEPPIHKDYVIEGWYSEAEGGDLITDPSYVIYGDMNKAYAQWKTGPSITVTGPAEHVIGISSYFDVTYHEWYDADGNQATPGGFYFGDSYLPKYDVYSGDQLTWLSGASYVSSNITSGGCIFNPSLEYANESVKVGPGYKIVVTAEHPSDPSRTVSGEFSFKISPGKVSVPEAKEANLPYNAKQDLVVNLDSGFTKYLEIVSCTGPEGAITNYVSDEENGKITIPGKPVGTYTIEFKLKYPNCTVWADETKENKTVTFEIEKIVYDSADKSFEATIDNAVGSLIEEYDQLCTWVAGEMTVAECPEEFQVSIVGDKGDKVRVEVVKKITDTNVRTIKLLVKSSVYEDYYLYLDVTPIIANEIIVGKQNNYPEYGDRIYIDYAENSEDNLKFPITYLGFAPTPRSAPTVVWGEERSITPPDGVSITWMNIETYDEMAIANINVNETYPIAAGEHVFYVQYIVGTETVEGKGTLVIKKKPISAPTQVTDTYAFTGESITFEFSEEAGDRWTVANGTQTAAGEYTVTLTVTDNYKWEDTDEITKEYTFKIVNTEVDLPTVNGASSLVYNGEDQNFSLNVNTELCTVYSSDGTLVSFENGLYTFSAKNVGTYSVTMALAYPESTTWADVTTENKTVTFEITKAVNTNDGKTVYDTVETNVATKKIIDLGAYISSDSVITVTECPSAISVIKLDDESAVRITVKGAIADGEKLNVTLKVTDPNYIDYTIYLELTGNLPDTITLSDPSKILYYGETAMNGTTGAVEYSVSYAGFTPTSSPTVLWGESGDSTSAPDGVEVGWNDTSTYSTLRITVSGGVAQAGAYPFVVKYFTNEGFVEAYGMLIILPKPITAPTPVNGGFYSYTGSEITFGFNEDPNGIWTVSNATGTNAGQYNVTVSLTDTNNYNWSDDSTDPINYTFEIISAETYWALVETSDGHILYFGNSAHAANSGETIAAYGSFDSEFTSLTTRPYNFVAESVKKVVIESPISPENGSYLFAGLNICTEFVGLNNLQTFDFTDVQHMFDGCSSLTALDISSFDFSNVTSYADFLKGCNQLKTLKTPKINAISDISLGGLTFVDSADSSKLYTLLPVTSNESKTLLRAYKITFNKNDDNATGTMEEQYYGHEQNQSLTPNAFINPGYTFKCWNYQSDGNGLDIYDKSSVIFDQDITLYAQWTPNVHSVTANTITEGGTVSGSGDYSYGSTVTINVTTNEHYSVKSIVAFKTGDPSVTVAVDSNGNFTMPDYDVTVDVSFNLDIIEVAEPTVSGTYTYTGSELTAQLTGVESYMTVSGHKATDAGTYTITVTLANGYTWADGSDGQIQWTIDKAQASITVDTSDINVTYGTAVVLPTATTNFGTVSCDTDAASLVSVGTYTVTYTVTETENYYGDTKTVNVTIGQAEVAEPTVIGTYTYTGNEQTVVLNGFDDSYMTIVGNKKTNAGTYEAVIELNENYVWSDGSDGKIQWTINKADPTVVWPESVAFVNDTTVTKNGGSASGVNDETVSGSFLLGTVDLTSEGIKSAVIEFTPNSNNYNAAIKTDYTVTVSKRTVKSVDALSAIENAVYGTEIDDLGLPATVTIRTEDGKVFNNVKVNWSGYVATNLDPQTLIGSLDLTDIQDEVKQGDTQVNASIVVDLQEKTPADFTYNSKTAIYDGTPISNEILGALEGIASITYTYKGEGNTVYAETNAAPVNAGTYSVTAEFIMEAGYSQVASKTASLTIEQKEISLVWSQLTAAELVYDGTEKVLTATAGLLVDGDICNVTVEPVGDNLNADTFYYKATGLSNANYKLPADVNSPEYTITPKTLTVTAGSYIVYAGGMWPELEYSVDGFAAGDGFITKPMLTVESYQGINGIYEVIPYGADAGTNYTITYVNGTMAVRPNPFYPSKVSHVNIFGDIIGGTVTSNRNNGYIGDTVVLTVSPEQGYELIKLNVTDSKGNPLKVTKISETKYSFTLNGNNVSVDARFLMTDVTCPGDGSCPMSKYIDLNKASWYHDGIHFCTVNRLMQGVEDNRFDPDGTTSRAMIVTILWRLEGEPIVSGNGAFNDVSDGQWYSEAVRWATANGIVEGYNGSFRPNDAITREQLATILYRYEQYRGGGYKGLWMYNIEYSDTGSISGWAYEAMCWMNMNKIINGRPGNVLDPLGSASRAEAAAMLQRYCSVMAK